MAKSTTTKAKEEEEKHTIRNPVTGESIPVRPRNEEQEVEQMQESLEAAAQRIVDLEDELEKARSEAGVPTDERILTRLREALQMLNAVQAVHTNDKLRHAILCLDQTVLTLVMESLADLRKAGRAF